MYGSKDTMFVTERITVTAPAEVAENLTLLNAICDVLSPKVVEHLPPYFQHVNSPSKALEWLHHVHSEGQVFYAWQHNTLLGFLLVSGSQDDAYIGYVLAEPFWGQGLATELLAGFIQFIRTNGKLHRLIGGVDDSNLGSIRVLEKLGFEKQPHIAGNATFYQLTLD